ncbi:lipid-A-disaccharide synthase [Marinomonas polaris]|jgi:lipid-A-disaccharide synthase|uniref:Lipid-A-disaccharide synthase n=1 Tax=Marinomonas polaris DSM 16579 TaxID=1122206 RepID=A0A1M5C5R0_9GAMM|nr:MULTISPECIES: lipid-A-disaccharide synthase [Marinomonas]PJE56814.1 lipid-A-disaccharide synthase [Marinomonas sp. BSi20584]SHF49947.1 lipid-A-disaccharide synthase [Marinomonas polaris DSM 16579]|tara:strand:+ start:11383 stop:12540 length:1158 start_codon:yes stop_codon:yes gene_type:complete
MQVTSATRYVLVAGEASGDILGANLIAHLKMLQPEAIFEGIGGPLMEAQGFKSVVPMDRLSVMGLVEVLGRLRELLGIRKRLYQSCLNNPPTAFIGIDSPDFNMPLARKLKQAGIPTVHYVSPSVWAWRQKRIFNIKKSIDLMLALFPFELPIYHEHDIPVVCVGHTLADDIPFESDVTIAREKLNLGPINGPVFGILPGSREGEVSRLAPLFIDTIKLIKQKEPSATFLIPASNKERRTQIEAILHEANAEAILIDGQSRTVMAASDAILLASGTAALEAMLVKRPMVVSYRVNKLTFAIMSRMVKVPYVSLPNLLANEALVPELLQDDATPDNLATRLLQTWRSFITDKAIQAKYLDLHTMLRKNAGAQAAQAIVSMLEGKDK